MTRLLPAAATALLLLGMASAAQAQTPCVDGRAGAYACKDVDLVAHLSPADLGGTCVTYTSGDGTDHTFCANDIWGWVDDDATEYALVGTGQGTVFVRLADPAHPEVLGLLPTVASNRPDRQLWRDIKTVGHVAFVGSEVPGHGVQVFDLTRLRGLSAAPARRFEADARYTGVGSSHNLVASEAAGFVYAVGARPAAGMPAECASRGFHAIDVHDPLHPTFAGCFSDAARDVEAGQSGPGYTHDGLCLLYDGPDADYAGREICIGSNEDEVTVFDATDKADVRIVSMSAYPKARYTHQSWLTEDRKFLLVDDELDEYVGFVPTQRTMIFDVEDLDSPELVGIYDSGLPVIDHNQYVRGGFSYQSNYEAGLRILDLSKVAEGTLTEVAFFDTHPQSQDISFDGQWSNYPFFPSGIVVANDEPNGLFVLRPRLPASAVVEPLPEGVPFDLGAARPTPFAERTRLRLAVAADQRVVATLVDLAGREVARLFAGSVAARTPVTLTVEGEGLPAGVYVVRVVGETFEASRRVVLTR